MQMAVQLVPSTAHPISFIKVTPETPRALALITHSTQRMSQQPGREDADVAWRQLSPSRLRLGAW